MRKVILCFIIFLIFESSGSCNSINKVADGNKWRTWDIRSKIFYIMGFANRDFFATAYVVSGTDKADKKALNNFVIASIAVEQIIDGLDYTGMNWYQAIRFPGFFGKRQKEFEEEVWKDTNYENWQIRNELNFTYKCEIGMIPSCIGNVLDNLLQANTTLITDYNQKNFDYNIIQKPVRLAEISETKYDNNRQAVYNLTFSDRKDNHIKINC